MVNDLFDEDVESEELTPLDSDVVGRLSDLESDATQLPIDQILLRRILALEEVVSRPPNVATDPMLFDLLWSEFSQSVSELRAQLKWEPSSKEAIESGMAEVSKVMLTLHLWVQKNLNFDPSCVSAAETLEKRNFRCGTVSDLIAAYLDEHIMNNPEFEHLNLNVQIEVFLLYYATHKQAAIRVRENYYLLDPNHPAFHPIPVDEVDVALCLKDVKERRLAQLLGHEVPKTVRSQSSEKPSKPNGIAVQAHIAATKALTTALIPNEPKTGEPTSAQHYKHASLMALLAAVVRNAARPIQAAKKPKNKNLRILIVAALVSPVLSLTIYCYARLGKTKGNQLKSTLVAFLPYLAVLVSLAGEMAIISDGSFADLTAKPCEEKHANRREVLDIIKKVQKACEPGVDKAIDRPVVDISTFFHGTYTPRIGEPENTPWDWVEDLGTCRLEARDGYREHIKFIDTVGEDLRKQARPGELAYLEQKAISIALMPISVTYNPLLRFYVAPESRPIPTADEVDCYVALDNYGEIKTVVKDMD